MLCEVHVALSCESVMLALHCLQVLEDGTVPMEKVFISISGGEMRSSDLTSEDGTVIYSDVVGVVRNSRGVPDSLLQDFSFPYFCL